MKHYRLGCPVWGRRDWIGTLLPAGCKPGGYLREYGRVFNAVEGNTTFYATPTADVVAKWREASDPDFRFCFKLPRVLTHERMLEAAGGAAARFVDAMAPLQSRLGPFMIQLPPAFGPPRLSKLEAFLGELPRGFDFAVEVRHAGFGPGTGAGRRLAEVLAAHGFDRVVLDARAIHAREAPDEDTAIAQQRKPLLEPAFDLPGRHPIVRFIGDHEFARNDALFAPWIDAIVAAIERGAEPYVFVHCPNDANAPALARRLHGLLRARVDVGEVPPFPGDRGQQTLF